MTLQQIAMNPTAWASAGQQFDPLRASSLAINALQAGAQESRAKESFAMAKEERAATKADQMAIKAKIQESLDLWRSGDRQGLRRSIGELGALDPQAAQGIAANFGTLDYQSFGESAYNVLSAASINDPEGQNKLLANARDIIAGSNPQHPFVEQIDQLMRMPAGKEKDKGIFQAVEFAKTIAPNLFGGSAAPKPKPTDIDDYVADAAAQYKAETGQEMPPGLRNEARLQFKRAQAEEVSGIAREKKLAEGTAGRATTVIDEGMSASESIPTLKRSLELLETVKSSGWRAAIQPAKDFFGVTGADEGELISNLGTSVLQQLRPMLGAAFTEREGARLERIMAGFGKNPEVNKRLLNQILKTVERKARMAIKRAEDIGDTETADDIREAIGFSLSPEKQPEKKQDLKSMSTDDLLKGL